MPIVLAENFQNNNTDSILTKYPGSYKSSAYTVPTQWVVDGASKLMFEKVPTSGFSKIEFYLTFTGAAGASTTGVINLFGVTLQTPSATQLAVNGNTLTAASTFAAITYLHLVFVNDGSGYWTGYAYADNGLQDTFVGGIINWTNSLVGATTILPSRLTSILVATDTPAGTRLKDITWTNAALTATNAGTWEFTDQGFVEDTNKSDPSVLDPNIKSATDSGVITFTAPAFDAVQWHVSGRTDNMDETILQLDSTEGVSDSYRLLDGVKSRSQISADLKLSVRPPTTKVIAQPDFSRMDNKAVAIVDDYSVNPWTYSPSAVLTPVTPQLFGGNPNVWGPAGADFTIMSLPADFGLRPLTFEVHLTAAAVGRSGGYFGLYTGGNWLAGAGPLSVSGGTSRVGSILGPGLSIAAYAYFAVVYIPTSGKSGYCYGYLNGTRVGTTAALAIDSTLRIISSYAGGYMTNLRITEDVLYPETTSIPVPTAPWPKP